ncbi:anti-sigma regulatory factor (Ser/Thr protein kinase) [Kitasatospora sp. GP82]|nr:anti-sigma regulatory factor (Ser/Thr protein kinase) [Kitasatospora sp. GP82]
MSTDHRLGYSHRTLYAWGADEPNPTAQARSRLHDALTDLGVPPDTLQDALVMASELTANAHCHATTPCSLKLILTEAAIVVEVHDSDPQYPALSMGADGPPTSADDGEELDDPVLALAESGRGLQIVHALSQGLWGFRTEPPGKAAWFALTRSVLPEGRAVSRLGSDTASGNASAITPQPGSAHRPTHLLGPSAPWSFSRLSASGAQECMPVRPAPPGRTGGTRRRGRPRVTAGAPAPLGPALRTRPRPVNGRRP